MEFADIKFSSFHYMQQLSDFDKIEIYQGVNDNRYTWNEAKAEGELRWRSDLVRNQIMKAVDDWIKNNNTPEKIPAVLRNFNLKWFEANRKNTNTNEGPPLFDIHELLVGIFTVLRS